MLHFWSPLHAPVSLRLLPSSDNACLSTAWNVWDLQVGKYQCDSPEFQRTLEIVWTHVVCTLFQNSPLAFNWVDICMGTPSWLLLLLLWSELLAEPRGNSSRLASAATDIFLVTTCEIWWCGAFPFVVQRFSADIRQLGLLMAVGILVGWGQMDFMSNRGGTSCW